MITDNMRGAAFMLAAMAGFSLNDAVMKYVLEDAPLFQSIFVRGVIATALLFIYASYIGAMSYRPRRADALRIGLRAVAELAATVLFFSALVRMPFANLSAVMQVLPLSVTLGAAFLLGESIGWRRATAILIGFCGVLLIIRPDTDGFSQGALFALACVGAVTIRELITRKLSPDVPSLYVAFVTALAITCGAGLASLFQPWSPVTPGLAGLSAIAALFILVAYVTSVGAVRVGDIAVVAPFRYTALLWALVIGVLVFEEVPDRIDILGAALIVGMGVFSFYREQRLAARSLRGH